MTVSVEGMHAQISGQVKTLEKMTAKERSQHPNVAFAKNYNDQLALAKEAMPDVDQRRWPPEATIFTPAMGQAHADATYIDIRTYFAQIAAILSEGISDGWGVVVRGYAVMF